MCSGSEHLLRSSGPVEARGCKAITFEDFCDAHLEGLARYARLLCPDRFDAQDLLQDALFAAHLRWDRVGKMEHPAAYVRTIITSKHLKTVQRWSFRHVRVTDTGDMPDTPVGDPSGLINDRDQLRALLQSLTPRQRTAVVLRHFVGLPDAQIAAELGISTSTVASLISRALTSLRQTTLDAATRKATP